MTSRRDSVAFMAITYLMIHVCNACIGEELDCAFKAMFSCSIAFDRSDDKRGPAESGSSTFRHGKIGSVAEPWKQITLHLDNIHRTLVLSVLLSQ